jgi:hypothetical protein
MNDIVDKIKAGCHIETAYKSCGIHRDTYYRWRAIGEQHIQDNHQSLYAEFAEATNRVTNDAEVRNILLINNAAVKDWRAALAFLERRYPERWAKHEQLDLQHTGQIDSNIIISYEIEQPPQTKEESTTNVNITTYDIDLGDLLLETTHRKKAPAETTTST